MPMYIYGSITNYDPTIVVTPINPTRLLLPSDISSNGLLLWLDSADTATITASNGNVSQWKDKSSQGYNFTTYSSYPPKTYNATVNGLNILDFTNNSGTSIMQNTNINYGNKFSIFVVGNTFTTSLSASIRLISDITDPGLVFGSVPDGLVPAPFGAFVGSSGGWVNTTGCSPSTSINQMSLMCITNDNTSANSLLPYVNGTALNAKQGNSNNTFSGLSLSGPTSAYPQWNGYAGEIIIYKYILSSSERERMEGYLAWKWGLQSNLPIIHPYKNAAPIISNYFTNISITTSNGTYPLSQDVSLNGPDLYGTSISTNGLTYKVYTFTIPNITYTINYTCNDASQPIYMLAVGGGGGGGKSAAGGGGAGGVIDQSFNLTTGTNTITVSIGIGGKIVTTDTYGYNGGNTVVSFASIGKQVIAGGGNGGQSGTSVPSYTQFGSGGGSGYNGSSYQPGTSANTNEIGGSYYSPLVIYANKGGQGGNANGFNRGGGGGGAGTSGRDYNTPSYNSWGGDGIQSNSYGIKEFMPGAIAYGSYYWGGGGGAANGDAPTAAGGGKGGGGGGYNTNTGISGGAGGTNGINPGGSGGNASSPGGGGKGGANTGGGGGSGWNSGYGGEGGSGIVIIAFP